MSDPICFVSSVFCSGVKETVEDNCILAHNILEMLETPFQIQIEKYFREHALIPMGLRCMRNRPAEQAPLTSDIYLI
jgi:hypothetical protein